MQVNSLFKNSFIYRNLANIYSYLQQKNENSFVGRTLTSVPSYAEKGHASSSAFCALTGKLAGALMSPLLTAGSLLRRSLPNSYLFNVKKPGILESSLAWQTLAGARVETALWLAALYSITDYLIRNLSPLKAFSGSWDEMLLVLLVVAWPLQMALRGKASYRYTMMDIPILIYIGVVLFLFFLRSPDASLALEGARVYIQYLLWYFIATNLIINRRQWNALVTGLVAMATFVALIGIYQYIVGVEMPAGWVDQAEAGVRTRVFSIVTSPNVLGSLLVLLIPLTISKIINLRQNVRGQLIYAACLAVMLACLLFTYSRGAWLALAGGLALYSLLYSPKMLLVMALGGVAALKLVPGIGSRLSYMFSAAYMASSQKAGRLARWDMGLDRLKENLWFGEGFGRFGGAVAARRIPGSFYVDNFYLKTAVESGLIGLLALLWLLLSAFRCGLVTLRKLTDDKMKLLAAGILAGLTGVMLHNGVENIFEVPMMTTYFWFMAGMLAAAPELED